MEAYITDPDTFPHADPLTRLLAAILEWLRALLAAHQDGLRPPAPSRRVRARKTAETSQGKTQADEPLTPRAPVPALEPAPEMRPRDMTAGIPRPRPVAPH